MHLCKLSCASVLPFFPLQLLQEGPLVKDSADQ